MRKNTINSIRRWSFVIGFGALFCAFVIVSSSEQVIHAVSMIGQIGLDFDGENPGGLSGASVAMSADGTRFAIGAPNNDGNGASAGHVRVYSWNGTAWTQTGSDIDGETPGDKSGSSVAMSADGTRIAIGAPNNDENGTNAGHVRIYSWNGTTWTQTGSDINGENAEDQSGYSVAMSADGNRIAIGAPLNSDNGLNAGHVRIYSWNGTTWTQTGSDIDGETPADESGYSIAMSADGNRIAIGAPFNSDNGSAAGHVRVFSWDGSDWTQTGSDIHGEDEEDQSGYSVAMSAAGHRIAIGAPFNEDNGPAAGHVRIYSWEGTDWTQTGPDINGGDAMDFSGGSIAMSATGNRITIGATGNDAGHARIYTWNGSDWTQTGPTIDGEDRLDMSGYAVAMSADGNHITIGAPFNIGSGARGGTTYGHVRFYEIATTPDAPTISSVTAANGSLSVAFTPGANDGSPITNYKYSIDGTNFVALNPATTTSPLNVSGLTNGTTYSVTIKAVNGYGDSPASNTVVGTPIAPTSPIVAPTYPLMAIAKTVSLKTGATSSLSRLIKSSNISLPQTSNVLGSVSKALSSICRTSGSKLTGVAPGKCIVKIKISPKKGTTSIVSMPINIVGSPSVKRGASITLTNAAAAAGLTTGNEISVDAYVATSSTRLCKVSRTKIMALKVGRCSVTMTVTSGSGATSTKQLTIKVK